MALRGLPVALPPDTVYGVGVLPARPRRPKDKAKVENGVRFAQTCILGRLRRQGLRLGDSGFTLGGYLTAEVRARENLSIRANTLVRRVIVRGGRVAGRVRQRA